MNQQARALAGKVGPTISEFSGGRGSHRAGLRNKAGATGDLPGVNQDIGNLVGKIRPYLPYHEGQQNTPRSPEDRQEIAIAVAKAFGFRDKVIPQVKENIEKIIEQYDRIAALLNEYKQQQDLRVNVAQKLGGKLLGIAPLELPPLELVLTLIYRESSFDNERQRFSRGKAHVGFGQFDQGTAGSVLDFLQGKGRFAATNGASWDLDRLELDQRKLLKGMSIAARKDPNIGATLVILSLGFRITAANSPCTVPDTGRLAEKTQKVAVSAHLTGDALKVYQSCELSAKRDANGTQGGGYAGEIVQQAWRMSEIIHGRIAYNPIKDAPLDMGLQEEFEPPPNPSTPTVTAETTGASKTNE